MPTTTTNYGLNKPLVNNPTDQDLWGGYLNGDMDSLDGVMLTAMNFTPSSKSGAFNVTAPTAGSTTTGSAKILYLCDATSAGFAASLPAASTATGMTVAFKKTDSTANAITVTGNGAETIDGSNTFALSTQYNWLMLVCNGTSWSVLSKTPSTAVTSVVTVKTQAFTANGTYTPSTGMLYCLIEMVGGGGGGGGGAGSGGNGGGGGGEYARGIFSAATIGGSQAVTIGALGAGGSSTGSAAGNAGGTTSVGSLITAFGGSGSPSNVGGVSTVGGAGGTGGTGGTLRTPGQAGGALTSGTQPAPAGGNSYFGFGGAYTTTSGTVNNGTGYGAGGSGVVGSAHAGGNGTAGYVIITEYCSQ